MTDIVLVLAALTVAGAFVSIAVSVRELARNAHMHGVAANEVAREMGDEWASDPVETGLYHPTREATEDSFARRAEADRRERFDPTEAVGEESIFDFDMEPPQPTGLFPSG